MRGRKPVPVEKRLREGNAGHRRLPEPVLVAGRPTEEDLREPPEELDEDAKEVWRRDVVKLVDAGIADRVDFGALEALCTAYARAKQARRVVATQGLFAAGSNGQLRTHPAVKIEAESWALYLRLAEQYGITPVSRTRLGLAELSRRTLASELQDKLGAPTFEPIDVEVVDDGAA